jgi:carboxyl-terminal processing protease
MKVISSGRNDDWIPTMLATLAAFAFTPFLLQPTPIGSARFEDPAVARRQVADRSDLQQGAPQDKGRVLSDVFELLDNKYIRELGSDKLFDSGLKALLKDLDPHSRYFNPQEAKEFRRGLKDQFAGIGVILKPETTAEHPEVMGRFLNAPAARAGIQKGDLIVEIDGKSTRGWPFEKIAGHLMGPVGTRVSVSVRRSGQEKIKTFSIRRNTIQLSSIRGLDRSESAIWLDEKSSIGYIRISRFAEDTVSGFRSAFSQLKKRGMKALAIDLRCNFGGLLSAAVKTADIFVDSGLIVRSVGRGGKENKWTAHKGEEVAMPIAVLINEDSASASEVFTACLQDHHRALIVGVRSYGKGSIQQLFDVGKDGAMVKLTTALYYPPSGRNIDKLNKPQGSDEWGISPDPGLEVKLEQAENEAWKQTFFAMDDKVGTDADLPPYASTSDKVLMAARDALRKALGIP